MEETGKKHIDSMSDAELIHLALLKDERAFSALHSKYGNALRIHICKFIQNEDDVQDICQRSFEKAFLHIDKYNPQYAFPTWLFSIAQNEAKDCLRKARNTAGHIYLSETDAENFDIATGFTPEEEVIINQAVGQMIKTINELPEKYREVAELRFISDFAYEDIAKAMDMPIGTVKTRLNRARKILMQSVENENDESDN